MSLGQIVYRQVKKLKHTFGLTYDTMSKRFLRNQLPVDHLQIHRQKCLTEFKKFARINHTSPLPVFYTPANDGADQGTKAGPKWLEQYVAKQTNLSKHLSAQPVTIDTGCAFCSLEIAPHFRGCNKKSG